MKRILPWIAIVLVLIGVALLLRSQGRLWVCSCGYLLLWSGDPWSSDNSQHLLDPYSFTPLLHGALAIEAYHEGQRRCQVGSDPGIGFPGEPYPIDTDGGGH